MSKTMFMKLMRTIRLMFISVERKLAHPFNYFNCMSSAITLHRNDQEVRLNSVVY